MSTIEEIIQSEEFVIYLFLAGSLTITSILAVLIGPKQSHFKNYNYENLNRFAKKALKKVYLESWKAPKSSSRSVPGLVQSSPDPLPVAMPILPLASNTEVERERSDSRFEGAVDLTASTTAGPIDGKALNAAKFRDFKIIKITQISHDTKLFRFEIPHGLALNLPLGRHVSVRAGGADSTLARAYTPVTKSNQEGFFELVIKRYEDGKVTPYLHSLSEGASVKVRGPMGRFNYVKNSCSTVGLIAGGTGITPPLQFLRCILDGGLEGYADDTTKFVLFYQNKTEDDILVKEVLDDLAARFPDRLKLVYFVNTPRNGWEWERVVSENNSQRDGSISQDCLNEFMGAKKAELVCLCGPPGFNAFVKDMLKNCGHSDHSIYVW